MLDQSLNEPAKPRRRLPNQRWQISPQQTEFAQKLALATNISPIVSQLLVNRGVETVEQAQIFLDPESLVLPSPLEEFPDLAISVELLENAIALTSQ